MGVPLHFALSGRCEHHRALSTKESVNASAGPRATASLPQLMVALTSSCISPSEFTAAYLEGCVGVGDWSHYGPIRY